jgi:VWFA-related protein
MIALPRTIFLLGLIVIVLTPGLAQQPSPIPLPYSESIPYKPRLFKVKPDKKSKDKDNRTTTTPQMPQPEQMPGKGPAVKEDLPITIPVSVFDAQGNFVSDLKKEDFKMLIDGPEASVISVEQRSDPLNVYLVIDTSASSTDLLASAMKLGDAIIRQFHDDDKVSVFRFSDQLKQLVPLTTDRATLKAAIDKIDSKKIDRGGTAIYDVTAELFEKYVAVTSGRTIVIMLTDGVDTTSRSSLYSHALVSAEKSDATVFPVYLDTFVAGPRPRTNDLKGAALLPWDVRVFLNTASVGLPGSSQAEYELGRLYLNDLVYLSGGRAVDAKSLLENKAKVSLTIADEMRKQYYVTFSPVGSAYIGQRKHLKVRINRPDLAVIARGSYIVGSPPSKVATQ